MSEESINAGLAYLDAMPSTERRAFLGLFAGARRNLTSFNGKPPSFGKAECEWVADWRNFYGVRLPAAGLTTFGESEPRPALGMAPGSTFTDVFVIPTELGRRVRQAWWDRGATKSAAAADSG